MNTPSRKENLTHNAYIGLGSNLGRRKKNITTALSAMESAREIEIVRVSPLYETQPEGGPPDQPAFINGVVRIQTSLSPERLLAVCRKIEGVLGRERGVRWGPRTIDLDVLSFDDEVRSDPELTLPHPMLHERGFVLKPLADIAPDWIHPVLRETAQALLDGLGRRDWVHDSDE